ncbi:MAG: protein-(glutamine-N5) methyltransferase, release factor-specific [Kangiella sp.]|nr:MAG: protein-(glutamine-N5) methyltransferase, release factor-specific [Kangiella sp.]
MNVKDAIQFVKSSIESSNAEIDSEVDARYLLSFILNKDFTWLKTWPEKMLDDADIEKLTRLTERRKKGEPIAYITGTKDFWSLTLKTNPSTLIPRPETELLVESALAFLENKKIAKILDLGTGTGAIGLAIASEKPNSNIVASDFQKGAVDLAKENAQLNNIDNIDILLSDWFSNITTREFDLIVSNPPYVEADDPHLKRGDLVFEPDTALVALDNGLSDIKIIVAQSKQFLLDGGALMIEHGFEQGKKVRELYVKQGFREVKTIKDLSGLDRITVGISLC